MLSKLLFPACAGVIHIQDQDLRQAFSFPRTRGGDPTARGAVGEGAEEAVSGFLDPYLQRATYDKDAENATAGELAYQAAIGAALGGILGGGSNALDYRSSKKVQQRAEAEAKKREQESNTFDTDSNTLGDRFVTTTESGQKAIVRSVPTDEDMKRITPEYERSVDSGLLQFVRDVNNKIKGVKSFKLSNPEPGEVYSHTCRQDRKGDARY